MLMEATAPPSEPRLIILDVLKRRIVHFGILMIGLNLALPIGFFLYSLYIDQPYWHMFRGEDHAVDWFSSIQLLLIATIAYFNYKLATHRSTFDHREFAEHQWIWLLLAFGFTVFSLDEGFDFHEALRNDLFRPSGLFTEIPGLLPGDVGLYLFFIIGLALMPFILVQLRDCPGASILLLAAMALTLPTLVIDSMTDEIMKNWPYKRFWDYAFEEVGEIWAQLLFLLSFLAVLYQRFDEWAMGAFKPVTDTPSRHL